MREKVELFFIVSFFLIFGLDAKIRNLEIVSISLIEDALVGEFSERWSWIGYSSLISPPRPLSDLCYKGFLLFVCSYSPSK